MAVRTLRPQSLGKTEDRGLGGEQLLLTEITGKDCRKLYALKPLRTRTGLGRSDIRSVTEETGMSFLDRTV